MLTTSSPKSSSSRGVVVPFARALELLAAFTPDKKWLGNSDLAMRTKLPASTVTRIVQTLVTLGYLRHDAKNRKYRLAPSALTLGYGATANSEVQQVAYVCMQSFAERHKVHVSLSSRERLDMIVLENYRSVESTLTFNLHVGVRLSIASSPVGWALLAGLPELERYYLLENIERRMPLDWPRLRRRALEGLAQVSQMGFCTSLGEWDSEIGIVAAPMLVKDYAPLVLTCIGSSQTMTRSRVEREIGPQLVAMAASIRQKVSQ
ncbi:IclR family transcriptional regulator [Pollutimonas nitritireducens]|uniref:IclR family transcriptional regulator n=1 Tax=Pollutimonas nitritireducens TaxID=2045209 RepID=A0A2N4UG73_9BURK|nr:helix-turn-helix domain-containing protein [Pollutimonas nitritireducens]PLC53985.1 IclR family transcriptional regulator [Pollutimonas nitritireducens]